MRFDRLLLAGSAIALVLTASVSARAADNQVAAELGLYGSLAVEGERTIAASTFAAVDEERTAPTTVAEAAPPKPLQDRVPSIEPAEVVITAADVGSESNAEQAKAGDQQIRLTNIPGARVEANADPNTTSSITMEPAAALTPAAPAQPSAPAAATPPETSTPAASTPAAPMPPEITLSPFGEKLRSMMADSQSAKMFNRDTLNSLSTFYAARKFEPLWTDKGVMTDAAKKALAQLKTADDDGLDSADYRVPTLEANASVDALADFELKFTNAVVDYARHAAVGRVHWSRVARDIVFTTEAPSAADLLTKLSTASNAGAALASYFPQHKYYKALKDKLAELRGKKDKVEEEPIEIGSGPMLRLGMEDDRVPDLRKRLKVEGAADSKAYDEAVEAAVKDFQKSHGLSADGMVGPGTLSALNGKPAAERGSAHTIDIVLANMERWRWMPHDLGESHVIVNIPEFMLRVYTHGSLLWETRVVVGKTSTPTPLLTETMKFITVNPTWNVPPSIVYGEYLPALRQDPTVLARMGLRVSYAGGGVHISQPPGPGNALGRIRFNFPNKFLVYQHDTPDKYMFAHEKRAYSHGCMRVQNPDQYAEALLSIALPEQKYTAARIRGMYGRGEVNLNFPEPIPVHLTYQTAYVDSSGKLVIRNDVYGRDSRTIASLKSDNQQIAMPAAEPARRSRARRQVSREPVRQSSGFNFFGLFR